MISLTRTTENPHYGVACSSRMANREIKKACKEEEVFVTTDRAPLLG